MPRLLPRRFQPSIVHRLAAVILIRVISIVLPPAFMTLRAAVASPRRTSPAIMRLKQWPSMRRSSLMPCWSRASNSSPRCSTLSATSSSSPVRDLALIGLPPPTSNQGFLFPGDPLRHRVNLAPAAALTAGEASCGRRRCRAALAPGAALTRHDALPCPHGRLIPLFNPVRYRADARDLRTICMAFDVTICADPKPRPAVGSLAYPQQ